MNLNLTLIRKSAIMVTISFLLITVGTNGQTRYGLVVLGDLTAVSQRNTQRTVDILMKAPKESQARFQECKTAITHVLDKIKVDDTIEALKDENRMKQLLGVAEALTDIVSSLNCDVKQIYNMASLDEEPVWDADEDCDLRLANSMEGGLHLETALILKDIFTTQAPRLSDTL